MTAFEDEVLEQFTAKLRELGIDDAIVQTLIDAFGAERLPSADEILRTIEQHSGEPTA